MHDKFTFLIYSFVFARNGTSIENEVYGHVFAFSTKIFRIPCVYEYTWEQNQYNYKYYLDRVRKNQRKILEDILSYFFGKYLPKFIGIKFF